jgi:hypothetical protein
MSAEITELPRRCRCGKIAREFMVLRYEMPGADSLEIAYICGKWDCYARELRAVFEDYLVQSKDGDGEFRLIVIREPMGAAVRERMKK